MKIYDFDKLVESHQFSNTEAVLTIGVYDGFHTGHQRVLKETVALASAEGLKSVVITFSQNPKALTGRYLFSKPLMSERQMTRYLASLGVDYLVVIDFSPEFSKLSGEEFVARCCTMFSVRAVVVGEDFHCGYKADTSVKELKALVKRCSHEAKLIVPATYRLDDGRVNSTTLVRELLTQGKVSQVETLLGRYYAVDLGQIPLKITGLSLSFVIEDAVQLLPPPGVYQTKLNLSDGSTLEVIAHLTPDSLNLAGEFNVESSITYDYLEFVKEFIDDVDERDEESNC